MQNDASNKDFGKDHGLIHEVAVTGRKVGAGQEFWAKLAHNKELFEKVVAFVNRNGYEATISQKLAKEIMGNNFFGVEEAIKHFGVNLTEEQLVVLAEIPFSEATLQELKNTHILVAVFPMSILDIRDKVGSKLFYHHRDAWYNNESFAKEKGRVSWHFVCKTPVLNSLEKNWGGQQALLGEDDEVPTARIMVYAIIGHYLAIGEALFRNVYVRTFSVSVDPVIKVSSRVQINSNVSGSNGLLFIGRTLSDEHGIENTGLASTRKPVFH